MAIGHSLALAGPSLRYLDMVKFSLQEKGQQLWNKKSTDKCKKIFDLYEHEVTNGRRSAGPIECFAFATESRRECYRLHAMVFLRSFRNYRHTHTDRQTDRFRVAAVSYRFSKL